MRWIAVRGLVLRNLYLHRRSAPRLMEIVFWPVMDLFVWGLVSVWMQRGGALPRIVDFLLGSIILWSVLYRSQLGVTVAFLEDIWARNFVNIFVTPVRMGELLLATGLFSAGKALLTALVLVPIAWAAFGCAVTSAGPAVLVAVLVLLLMGWALGIVTTALIIRYGHAAEALAWGIPYLIQPLSAVFYPLDVLPAWLRPVSACLPSTHAFEALRAALRGEPALGQAMVGLVLMIPCSVLAAWFFRRQFDTARERGLLARAGME